MTDALRAANQEFNAHTVRSTTGAKRRAGLAASSSMEVSSRPDASVATQHIKGSIHVSPSADCALDTDGDSPPQQSSMEPLRGSQRSPSTLLDIYETLTTQRRVLVTFYATDAFSASIAAQQRGSPTRVAPLSAPPSPLSDVSSARRSLAALSVAGAGGHHYHQQLSQSVDSAGMKRSSSLSTTDFSGRVALASISGQSVSSIASRDTSPAVTPSDLIGLEAVVKRLGMMISHYMDPVNHDLFSSDSPPDRLLYVSSLPGSGIHTLMSSICSRSRVNMIRVNEYTSDVGWSDDFFAMLLDFAVGIKPCVVFFDRCDFWFIQNKDVQGYHARGRMFEYAYKGHPTIVDGSEDVWLVFSMQHALAETPEVMQLMVSPSREIAVPPLDYAQVLQCLHNEVGAHNAKITARGVAKYPTMTDQIVAYMKDADKVLQEHCVHRGKNFQHYTPGMISKYVKEVFRTSRERYIETTAPSSTAAAPWSVVPAAPDFDTVIGRARIAAPGILVIERSEKEKLEKEAYRIREAQLAAERQHHQHQQHHAPHHPPPPPHQHMQMDAGFVPD